MKTADFLLKIFSFFFPNVCKSCGRVIDYDEDICKICKEKLVPINKEKACKNCGIEKPNCDCERYIYYFDSIACAYYNEGTAKNIMYSYKLGNKSYYLDYIAKEMVKTLNEKFPDVHFDYILSVPISNFKRVLNEYDYAGALAKKISKLTGIPLKKNVIGCKNFRQKQHLSSYEKRFKNVYGKYFVKRKINAENVLLIDDIKTTGATLNACARELLYAKSKKVYCLTYLAGRLNTDLKPSRKKV